MPLPGGLARFNRIATNRVTRPFAARLPWFGVLRHTGRNSGKVYETPMNAFRDQERIVVPLTYGPEVDWLRNALAGPSSVLVMGGRAIDVGPPYPISQDEGLKAVPLVVGALLGAVDVHEFVAFPLL